MYAFKFLVATAFCFMATPAEAAGFQFIEVPAGAQGPALKGAMWYPCSEPPGQIPLDAFTLSGTKDCPISGDKLPLVVISHGRGGSFISHHDTAETLADAGFVVAAVNHPGDNYADMSRSGDLSTIVERPSDIKRLIDFMLGASPARSRIDPGRVGFFGFSRGGYTGLVLIGANPDWAVLLCLHSHAVSACEQTLREDLRVGPLAHDLRIKAAVIANPLSFFFAADGFAGVRVPVQLWQSVQGGDGVTPESVAAVNRNLPGSHEYHVVPNSAHFAFMTPCPPALARDLPEPCTDPTGFDRAAFHEQFNAAVLAFFRTHLTNASQP